MSSKRNLKKAVKAVCGELYAGSLLACVAGNECNEESYQLMTRIAELQQDYIARINTPEPGMTPQKYYSKLRTDFIKQANEITDGITCEK